MNITWLEIIFRKYAYKKQGRFMVDKEILQETARNRTMAIEFALLVDKSINYKPAL